MHSCAISRRSHVLLLALALVAAGAGRRAEAAVDVGALTPEEQAELAKQTAVVMEVRVGRPNPCAGVTMQTRLDDFSKLSGVFQRKPIDAPIVVTSNQLIGVAFFRPDGTAVAARDVQIDEIRIVVNGEKKPLLEVEPADVDLYLGDPCVPIGENGELASKLR